MKKLELKNLKVKKIANTQLKEIKGGVLCLASPCENSAAMSCNTTSAWPINCNSAQAPICWVDDDGGC